MTFWHRRRVVQAAGLTFFGALVGIGAALCTDEPRTWVQVVGSLMVVIGVGGLLGLALTQPGGW